MSKNTKVILALFFVLFLMIIAMKPSKKEVKEAKEVVSPVVKPTLIPTPKRDVFKEEYMEGCLEGGEAGYEYCSCTYEYMKEKYGLSELVNMSIDYMETEKISDEIMEAAYFCWEE